MKRKKPNKIIKREIHHSISRAKERFGIDLREEDMLRIGKLIRTEQSIFVRAKSNRQTIHLVLYQGNWLRVAYDRVRKVPITIMTARSRDTKMILNSGGIIGTSND